jgi:multidrug resistance efflux pump
MATFMSAAFALRVVARLPIVCTALSIHRRIFLLPAGAQNKGSANGFSFARVSTKPATAAQHLNTRGPLALGVASVLLVAVAGLGASLVWLGDVDSLVGAIFQTRRAALHYQKVGAGARVHVAEGATVKAGDLIITRDTTGLDHQIVMLRAMVEKARSQLALIGTEAATMTAPTGGPPADRPRLVALEQRIADLERETQELLARIAGAEQELTRSEILAPVSGRVLSISVQVGSAPNTTEDIDLEIATADRSLLERMLDPILRGMRLATAVQTVAQPGSKP